MFQEKLLWRQGTETRRLPTSNGRGDLSELAVVTPEDHGPRCRALTTVARTRCGNCKRYGKIDPSRGYGVLEGEKKNLMFSFYSRKELDYDPRQMKARQDNASWEPMDQRGCDRWAARMPAKSTVLQYVIQLNSDMSLQEHDGIPSRFSRVSHWPGSGETSDSRWCWHCLACVGICVALHKCGRVDSGSMGVESFFSISGLIKDIAR